MRKRYREFAHFDAVIRQQGYIPGVSLPAKRGIFNFSRFDVVSTFDFIYPLPLIDCVGTDSMDCLIHPFFIAIGLLHCP